MNKRKLGKTGLEIAPLVFGGNVFGWTVDQATSFKLLDAFAAAGFNSVDTADVYSKWVPGHAGGESEIIIGEWMKRSGNRNKIIVATKVGMDMGDGKKGLSKSHILRSAEDSLRRLQTDYIDLYQSHVDDPDTPLEETLGAYAELLKQGKVRAIGASNHKAERLAAALETSRKSGLPAYQTLQPNYSLIERAEYESNLEPVCEKEGLGVINYFPLAGGFLTGKYRSENDVAGKARARNVTKYLNERGFKIRRGARPGCEEIQCHARQGFSRVAAGAAQHHGAHRERDESGAAEGFGFFRRPRTGPRFHRVSQSRQARRSLE